MVETERDSVEKNSISNSFKWIRMCGEWKKCTLTTVIYNLQWEWSSWIEVKKSTIINLLVHIKFIYDKLSSL